MMRNRFSPELVVALAIAMASSFALTARAVDAKAPSKSAKHELPIITTKQLKAKLDKHEAVTLVEALEPKYFNMGHLPHAIRLTDVDASASKVLPDKKAEIVVYCMNTY